MAIIKYKMVDSVDENGFVISAYPEYCILKDRFLPDPDTDYFITIGLGGGTELTKAELLTYALDIHTRYPFYNAPLPPEELIMTQKTTAEVETMINDWCTERNAS